MGVWIALGAVAASVAGTLLLYLATPHQKLTRRPLPKTPALVGGGAALVLALVLFLQLTGPATAVFVLMTAVMLLWSLPPVLFAWRRHRRKPAK